MATDTTILKRASQQFKLRFELGTSRSWEVVDVDADGADAGTPTPDPISAVPLDPAYDGVVSFGTISGSVEGGGFSCDLQVDKYPATFSDFFQVDIWARTWHGGSPGVVGASGIDPDEIRLFRGYQRATTSQRAYGSDTARFTIRSSSSFLQDSGTSRGFDWAASTPHGAPGTSNAVIAHTVEAHTNLTTGDAGTTRSNFGVYLPDHAISAWTQNEGPIYGQLKQMADNFALDGWVFCRREDDLFVGAHPNLIPDLHPTLNSPVIDLDDGLLLNLEVPEVLPRATATVTVVAQKSDQTEYTTRATSSTGGLGDNAKYSIRTDDTALADTLAGRMAAHLNRRYRAVKATTGLMLAVDLGDVLTLTTTVPQRGIAWSGKKFVCVGIEWSPNIQSGEFESVLTLDEVIV